MSENLYNHLIETLKSDERLVSEDEILKNKVLELVYDSDDELISTLVSDDMCKEAFFQEAGGSQIFLKEEFIDYLTNKQYFQSSYTNYRNKIGLKTEEEYISENKDLELAWPYKDCILEAHQSKEDEKRKEKFWNKTLEKEYVKTLEQPKCLTNFSRYTEEGEKKVKGIAQDDNLFIRGNNLFALYSLLRRYRRNIQMIYLDPPYNTGSDAFNYNDNFSSSSYLTFMKNRLEVAKQVLSEDGVIAVHSSQHQYPYLKVLMDDIFTNYLVTYHLKVRNPGRQLTGDKEYNDVIEYVMLYSNSNNRSMPKKKEKKKVDKYKYRIIEKEPDEIEIEGETVEVFTPDTYEEVKEKPSSEKLKRITVRGSIREKNSSGRYYVRNLEPLEDDYPDRTLFKVPDMGDDSMDGRYFYLPPEGNKNGGYYQGMPVGEEYTEKPFPNYYDFSEEYNNVMPEGGIEFRNGKKPESLIKMLIERFTDKGNTVLDFFLGSGTTSAVAHKMNRQYIGVEQLDYGDSDPTVRLKNVIDGDSTGISEDIGWNGGGSFVYAELKKLNGMYIEEVQSADNHEDLNSLHNEIVSEALISYYVNKDELELQEEQFQSLDIDEKKEVLTNVLDHNQMYVNYSDIDDSRIGLHDEKLKELNYQFYGDKDD